MHTVGIFGASGYTGLELCRLLARHPQVSIAFAGSERFVGKRVRDLAPIPLDLAFVDGPTGFDLSRSCDVVFLCTPHEVSLEQTPRLLEHTRVIDLSNAYRFDDKVAYGLPELRRADVPAARLVANPGCFPTAAQLALAPLLASGAISPDDVIVDAWSGVSGAGRKADEAYSFVELHDNARAYQVLRHRHTPEIARGLAHAAGRAVDVTFTPHLAPVSRGILATCYARATGKHDLRAILRERYAKERFVRVLDTPEEVSLATVVGTNDCAIGVAVSGTRVVVTSAIDNLIKGAAGQATQNLNLMLGLPEETAL